MNEAGAMHDALMDFLFKWQSNCDPTLIALTEALDRHTAALQVQSTQPQHLQVPMIRELMDILEAHTKAMTRFDFHTELKRHTAALDRFTNEMMKGRGTTQSTGIIPEGLACDSCCAPLDASPSWRYEGDKWTHKCSGSHPQAGHCGIAIPVEQARLNLEKELGEAPLGRCAYCHMPLGLIGADKSCLNVNCSRAYQPGAQP